MRVTLNDAFWRIAQHNARNLGATRGTPVPPEQWIEEAILERDLLQRFQADGPSAGQLPDRLACWRCGGEARLLSEERQVRVGDWSADVPQEFYRCGDCGKEFLLPGQIDLVMERAARQIREREGLLTAEKVRGIRERLGLTHREFERLLGVAPNTVLRWERGSGSQSRAVDCLIRLLEANPENARLLAARHGVELRTTV
jgi:putative zinc finger/helix-turn-helix YgiT family protein